MHTRPGHAYAAVGTLILYSLATTTDGAKNPLKYEAWNPACKLANELKKTPKRAAKILQTLAKDAQTAQQAALKLAAYANAAHSVNKTIAVLAISNLLQGEAARINDRLQILSAQSIRATATTAVLQGRIAEGLYLLKQAERSSGYCLLNNGGSAAAGPDPDLATCTKPDLEAAPEAAPIDSQTISADGFAKLTAVTGANAVDSSANDKCLFLQVGTTVASHTYVAGTQLLGGLITVSGTDTAAAGNHATGKAGQPRSTTDIYSAAHHDAMAINDLAEATTARPAQALITTLATTDKITAEINLLLTATRPEADKPKDDTEARQIMQSVLGTDGTKLNKLWTDIGGEDVEDVTKSAGTKVKVSTLTDEQRLLRTISYYIISSQAQVSTLQSDKEAAQESCRRGASKPEEVCNAIGDSEAKVCNATENCHFVDSNEKGKKCTLKKEVKEKLEKAKESEGKEEKKDEKCAGKLEDACKKDTGCKWDGKECKDSSILFHKKFDLSMAAAFVSLMF